MLEQIPARAAGIDPKATPPKCFAQVSPEPHEVRTRYRNDGERNVMGGIIWWILVGLIAGFITGKLMKGSGFGALGDIIIGIIGAVVGGFIMTKLGFSGQGGLIYTIFVAVIGAVLLTLLLRLITGNRSRNL